MKNNKLPTNGATPVSSNQRRKWIKHLPHFSTALTKHSAVYSWEPDYRYASLAQGKTAFPGVDYICIYIYSFAYRFLCPSLER